jgi:hypothetical protein
VGGYFLALLNRLGKLEPGPISFLCILGQGPLAEFNSKGDFSLSEWVAAIFRQSGGPIFLFLRGLLRPSRQSGGLQSFRQSAGFMSGCSSSLFKSV